MSHRAVRKAMARFDKLLHKRRRAPACSDENQHQNSADEVTKAPKSDLRHIGTTYIASSESLAATQFSQDNEKFAYSGHETYGCDEIRSPHTNRQQPLYYMQAGELETVHGGEPEDNGQSISPPHDAIYRPDWRQAAAQTGRAGNAYDYARSEPHLADRLFLQQELMPPDLALLAATHQAVQDSKAACLEGEALHEALNRDEAALQELEERVFIARERNAQLRAGNEALEMAIKERSQQLQ